MKKHALTTLTFLMIYFQPAHASPEVSVKDIKIELGLLSPCVDVEVEHVRKHRDRDRVFAIHLKQTLKKPIENCTGGDFSASKIIIVDSAKNELDDTHLTGSPSEIGNTTRDFFLIETPSNFKSPITIRAPKKN